jgi:hypothetical protein
MLETPSLGDGEPAPAVPDATLLLEVALQNRIDFRRRSALDGLMSVVISRTRKTNSGL